MYLNQLDVGNVVLFLWLLTNFAFSLPLICLVLAILCVCELYYDRFYYASHGFHNEIGIKQDILIIISEYICSREFLVLFQFIIAQMCSKQL